MSTRRVNQDDAEELGPIGVTVGYVDHVAELIGVASAALASIPASEEGLDRIVLIIPERLRQRLGWNTDRAPRPIVYLHDLVFHPPTD